MTWSFSLATLGSTFIGAAARGHAGLRRRRRLRGAAGPPAGRLRPASRRSRWPPAREFLCASFRPPSRGQTPVTRPEPPRRMADYGTVAVPAASAKCLRDRPRDMGDISHSPAAGRHVREHGSAAERAGAEVYNSPRGRPKRRGVAESRRVHHRRGALRHAARPGAAGARHGRPQRRCCRSSPPCSGSSGTWASSATTC